MYNWKRYKPKFSSLMEKFLSKKVEKQWDKCMTFYVWPFSEHQTLKGLFKPLKTRIYNLSSGHHITRLSVVAAKKRKNFE